MLSERCLHPNGAVEEYPQHEEVTGGKVYLIFFWQMAFGFCHIYVYMLKIIAIKEPYNSTFNLLPQDNFFIKCIVLFFVKMCVTM